MPAQASANTIANTLSLPCVARRVFVISSAADVRTALEWSASRGLPLLPLGEGSNVVLPPVLDAGVLQVMDTSINLLPDSDEQVTIRVGAGLSWHVLVSEALRLGYYGLENLALIPGLAGAAPVQNIGAYGVELAQFVRSVHGVNLDTGAQTTLDAADCQFAYRDSIFKQDLADRFLITAVELNLSRSLVVDVSYPALAARMEGNEATPRAVFDAVVALRRERLPDPQTVPNAGSFFKNPILARAQVNALQATYPDVPLFSVSEDFWKVPAAWLIDRCGLRGFALDQAAISDRHALVVVTNGDADQADVLQLAAHVQQVVAERFGIELVPEPRIYSQQGGVQSVTGSDLDG